MSDDGEVAALEAPLPEEQPASDALALQQDDQPPDCRICRCGTEAGPLLQPCLCSGSVMYVHQDCLRCELTYLPLCV